MVVKRLFAILRCNLRPLLASIISLLERQTRACSYDVNTYIFKVHVITKQAFVFVVCVVCVWPVDCFKQNRLKKNRIPYSVPCFAYSTCRTPATPVTDCLPVVVLPRGIPWVAPSVSSTLRLHSTPRRLAPPGKYIYLHMYIYIRTDAARSMGVRLCVRPLLHAWAMRVAHPVTGIYICIFIGLRVNPWDMLITSHHTYSSTGRVLPG